MKFIVKPWDSTKNKIISSPHFWAIIVMILALSLIYYYSIFYPDNRWLWFRRLEVFEFRNDMHGILFFIPFIYSAFIFWWQGALVTWLVIIALVIPRIFYFEPDPFSLITNLLYFMIPLMIVIYISMRLKWRAKERQTLEDREAERQSFMVQIFKAQEEERQRIARELHDDTTQTLLVLATHAESLSNHENVKTITKSKSEALWIRDTAISVSNELRRLSLDLRPGILDNLGLIPALRWLANNLSVDGISTRFEITGIERRFPPEVEIHLFRIVQEALNNIRRHSNATAVLIKFEFTPNVRIKIQDNGIGGSLSKTPGEYATSGKLGLAGMQQRAQFINANFSMDSENGKGTQILIELKA